MARCLVGCGSNLGKRREQLDRAVELLRFMPGVALVAVSRFRETRPVGGPAGQDAYLNGACLIETDLPPEDVLGMLAAVENTLHRERLERWGERTIDLDLLLYEDLVVETAELTVPHPRMATRRFVLEPSVEIAGDLTIPTASCTVRELLDNISVSHPLVAVVGVPGSGAHEVAEAVADATLSRLVRAPVPLPAALPPGSAAWSQTLSSWARPLAAAGWHDEPHGAIADFWLDSLAVAAADELPRESLARLEAELDAVARTTIQPHVAILLVADAATLEERVAFSCRQADRWSNVFADVTRSGVAVCTAPDVAVATLMRMQERLVERLRSREARSPRAPKAVVVVPADDLGRATAEATAAVEAML
jgi:2-amino-4-hydroxy-6-hydroxymethyldihydropteridine diphosphokinase